LDSDARIKLSIHLRSYDLSGWFPTDIPQNKSIFDYFPVCDVATGGQWVEWGAALPTGTALHNILSQSSQSFNRTRAVLSPCSRRVYVPTTQSVAMTFLCDLLLPRAVLLFGNSSCGCSSFAAQYSLLAKVNQHAHSKSAILRLSGRSSFESF